MKRAIFITGTDTGVGKSVIVLVLATLFKNNAIDVGVMKPLECGGSDAKFLRKRLGLKDPLKLINPCKLKVALAPYPAFGLEKKKFNKQKIIKAFKKLTALHEFLIIEGAGGLLVPIEKEYFLADLISDLDIPAVIVARLGLGTINHILLTLNQARDSGIDVLGVILNKDSKSKASLAEETNPGVIEKLIDVPILGILPHLTKLSDKQILKTSKNIDINLIFERLKKGASGWIEKDKKYLWHPFTQMKDWEDNEQLVIEAAKGCYLKTTDGKWYLDAVSSLWVNVHGHRKKEIDSAIKQQLGKVSHSTLLGLANIPSIELAQKLIDISPKGLSRVFFSDNGSTSVEIALKIAYQYWQNTGKLNKKKIVHLDNSYHGDTIGAVSVGGIDLFHKTYKPFLFETISVDSPYCYRCRLAKTYPECNFSCLERLEEVFQESNEFIAALIIEPIVQAAAGIIVWPKGALARIDKLCKKYNILLIADEVATGFGRTGHMFACEHEEVSPDIFCVAKGISAGYLPIAATLSTEKIYSAFVADYKEQKTFFHGHTYTGNALGCVAALANLEIFKKEKTLEKLQPKIKIMRQELSKFRKLDHVGDIRQLGFMVGIELVRNKKTTEPYPWQEKMGIKVGQDLRRRAIIMRPLGNVIVLMPPLSISVRELKFLLEKTYEAIRQVTLSADDHR